MPHPVSFKPHRPHIIIVTYPYRTGIKVWILGLDTYIFSSNYLDDSIKPDSRNKVFRLIIF